MGKVTKSHRHNTIKQHRKRLEKIRKLRAKFQSAEPKSREAIVQKLKKIHAVTGLDPKPK